MNILQRLKSQGLMSKKPQFQDSTNDSNLTFSPAIATKNIDTLSTTHDSGGQNLVHEIIENNSSCDTDAREVIKAKKSNDELKIRTTIVKRVYKSKLVWASCPDFKGGHAYFCARLCQNAEGAAQGIREWPIPEGKVLVEFFSLPETVANFRVVKAESIKRYFEDVKPPRRKKKLLLSSCTIEPQNSDGNDEYQRFPGFSDSEDANFSQESEIKSQLEVATQSEDETTTVIEEFPSINKAPSHTSPSENKTDVATLRDSPHLNGEHKSGYENAQQYSDKILGWNENSVENMREVIKRKYSSRKKWEPLFNAILKTAEEYFLKSLDDNIIDDCDFNNDDEIKGESTGSDDVVQESKDLVKEYIQAMRAHGEGEVETLRAGDWISYQHQILKGNTIITQILSIPNTNKEDVVLSSGDCLRLRDSVAKLEIDADGNYIKGSGRKRDFSKYELEIGKIHKERLDFADAAEDENVSAIPSPPSNHKRSRSIDDSINSAPSSHKKQRKLDTIARSRSSSVATVSSTEAEEISVLQKLTHARPHKD